MLVPNVWKGIHPHSQICSSSHRSFHGNLLDPETAISLQIGWDNCRALLRNGSNNGLKRTRLKSLVCLIILDHRSLVILPHGAKGDGQEYITGKGHLAEQIDDIIANPRPDLSGFIDGRGQLRGQDIRLLTGSDGHWVTLDQNGNVRASSNRNLPLSHKENYSGDIIRPLE